MRIDGETHSLDELPAIDRRRKHAVEVVIDRIIVRRDQRSRIAGSIENALAMGKGVVHVAHPHDDVPEPRWPVRVHSQHLACEKCGRSFDTLNPHNFSFNSSLGWCPACEGLGSQIGANPAALLRDPKLTLAKGAFWVWPDVSLADVAADARGLLGPHWRAERRALRATLPAAEAGHALRHGEEWIEVFRSAKGAEISNRQCSNQQSAPDSHAAFQLPIQRPVSRHWKKRRGSRRDCADCLEQFIDEIDCSQCGGSRLRDDAAAVRFRDRTLDSICRTPLGELVAQVKKWKLAANEKKVAGELVREIHNRLTFLVDVGLDYLTLGRSGPTLSGGEAQRIRLASQVGSGLCGVLYVLDEPTIGLHPRDNPRLISALGQAPRPGQHAAGRRARPRSARKAPTALFDFGPGAGRLGGQIVASGTPSKSPKQRCSVTGPYLSGKKAIPVPKKRRGDRRKGDRRKRE